MAVAAGGAGSWDDGPARLRRMREMTSQTMAATTIKRIIDASFSVFCRESR